jgi:hypothetical protein
LLLLSGLIRWSTAIALIVSGEENPVAYFVKPYTPQVTCMYQIVHAAQVLSCCLCGCCCNEDKSKPTVRQVFVGAAP